jgi:hypothetical protein
MFLTKPLFKAKYLKKQTSLYTYLQNVQFYFWKQKSCMSYNTFSFKHSS